MKVSLPKCNSGTFSLEARNWKSRHQIIKCGDRYSCLKRFDDLFVIWRNIGSRVSRRRLTRLTRLISARFWFGWICLVRSFRIYHIHRDSFTYHITPTGNQIIVRAMPISDEFRQISWSGFLMRYNEFANCNRHPVGRKNFAAE